MGHHPNAGKPAPKDQLIDVDTVRAQYRDIHPDPSNPLHRVAFGTSGHRGAAAKATFNEDHILAVTQAVCEYRASQGIQGPLFIGKDTHAVSDPAQDTALEVLAGNGVAVFYARDNGFTPTPVISHAILTYNRDHAGVQSDGIVVTPSHNPPSDGGIKYNPPHGGPADTTVTKWIEDRANALLAARLEGVKRASWQKSGAIQAYDFVTPYVRDLGSIIDLDIIKSSGLSIGADPLGGAGIGYWQPIKELYGLNLTIVNPNVDHTFAFMPCDHDGKVRMDCSSPFAMANLVALKDKYGIAYGNDTDFDRHGIVTPSMGLMNPNHYLAVAIHYLFSNRSGWRADAAIGKTLVSSSLIDRVANALGRRLSEVPVGFKWFVDGLIDGSYGFGGEESAGASFLRKDGTVWTTDKDGIILCLLAAEMTARTGKDPGELYQDLTRQFGAPVYTRIDAAATPEQKNILKKLSPESVRASTLAGDAITARLTRAPGNNADIGGLKVTTENGWFAARPSGTEDVYKIYAESFKDQAHLDRILEEAQHIVSDAFKVAVG